MFESVRVRVFLCMYLLDVCVFPCVRVPAYVFRIVCECVCMCVSVLVCVGMCVCDLTCVQLFLCVIVFV